MIRGLTALLRPADVAIFHEFHRPPYGGGNQFLLALRREFERRGLRVEDNALSKRTRACLFNSFNFDFERLRAQRRTDCRMVHRVDGPIGAYRGEDDGTDLRILEINNELGDATVFQSEYSRLAHEALGLQLRDPVVIMNAVDPAIFHPPTAPHDPSGRKVRLISTSWSSNPNKGAAAYQWLERHLDWDRFDYTFVGRTPVTFDRIRAVPAVPSEQLADLLRQHDIYITASLHDPCSNALLEALACGLPAVYADSGGHPEIVRRAGRGFSSPEEMLHCVEEVARDYDRFRAEIAIPSLAHVAGRYLAVMGLSADGGDRRVS